MEQLVRRASEQVRHLADPSISYATGAEIQQYLRTVSKQYHLDRDVHLNSEVKSAIWDEESGRWKVQILIKGTGVVDDWCDVLLNGSGVLKYVYRSECVSSCRVLS